MHTNTPCGCTLLTFWTLCCSEIHSYGASRDDSCVHGVTSRGACFLSLVVCLASLNLAWFGFAFGKGRLDPSSGEQVTTLFSFPNPGSGPHLPVRYPGSPCGSRLRPAPSRQSPLPPADRSGGGRLWLGTDRGQAGAQRRGTRLQHEDPERSSGCCPGGPVVGAEQGQCSHKHRTQFWGPGRPGQGGGSSGRSEASPLGPQPPLSPCVPTWLLL